MEATVTILDGPDAAALQFLANLPLRLLSVPADIVALSLIGQRRLGMCWMCDHPKAKRQDYLDHIMSLVASHCWAVQGVERDRYRPPYAYTVGLTAHDKPELVITGMSVTHAAELLNDVAPHLLHAPAPAPGERSRLNDGPLVEFIEVDVPSAHLLVACELYGPGLCALQMVHADDRDRWPWEPGYRGIKGGQPVLGARRARPARPPAIGR